MNALHWLLFALLPHKLTIYISAGIRRGEVSAVLQFQCFIFISCNNVADDDDKNA